MKFGIMSSQLELLIPGFDEPQELATHISKYSHQDLIGQIVSTGFKCIELSGDLEILLPHLYTLSSIKNLRELKSQLGVTFTVHLPLWSVETSTLLEPVREGSVMSIIEHIHKATRKKNFKALHILKHGNQICLSFLESPGKR